MRFLWAAAQNVSKAWVLSAQDLFTVGFYGAEVGFQALAHAGQVLQSPVDGNRKTHTGTHGYRVATQSIISPALLVLPVTATENQPKEVKMHLITATGISQRWLKCILLRGQKGRTHQIQSKPREQHLQPTFTSWRQNKSYCFLCPQV